MNRFHESLRDAFGVPRNGINGRPMDHTKQWSSSVEGRRQDVLVISTMKGSASRRTVSGYRPGEHC